MNTSFRVSIATSLYRLQAVRARLMTDAAYLDARRTMERTRRVHPYRLFRRAGVAEMLRVTLAFFVYIGAAVAGLLCGLPGVQLVIAVLLLVGAWPLWVTVKNAIARSEFSNALRYLADRLEGGGS